jgi:uncharacterized protein (TIGR03067 family)
MRVAAALVVVTLLGIFRPPTPAAARVVRLDGAWTVGRVSVDGTARADGKLLGSTWTFDGTELIVQQPGGARTRAGLSFDWVAEPAAVHVTPLDPPGERPVWMIVARQGGELRVAFYDGIDRRPEDFGPRPKLVVLSLVPATAATPGPDPCTILRTAGIEGVLGGPLKTRTGPPPAGPGSVCALDRVDGAGTASLTIVGPPAGASYLDVVRREARGRRGGLVDEEPTLGPGAFALIRGWMIALVAMRQGTTVVLQLETARVERAELRRLVERVLDRL